MRDRGVVTYSFDSSFTGALRVGTTVKGLEGESCARGDVGAEVAKE